MTVPNQTTYEKERAETYAALEFNHVGRMPARSDNPSCRHLTVPHVISSWCFAMLATNRDHLPERSRASSSSMGHRTRPLIRKPPLLCDENPLRTVCIEQRGNQPERISVTRDDLSALHIVSGRTNQHRTLTSLRSFQLDAVYP